MTFQTGVILCLVIFVAGAALLAYVAIQNMRKEDNDHSAE